MPVTDPNCPPVLREALEDMEAKVQSFKGSLPFAAPEMQDRLYIVLQHGLADTMATLYRETTHGN